MPHSRLFVSMTLGFMISGCMTAPGSLSTTPVSGAPFTMTVPKDLESAAGSGLKGVRLGAFENRDGKSPIRNFFAVAFKEVPTTSDLTTEICQGDLHDDGGRYKSCILYDARVAITEETSSYRITLSPYNTRAVQGRNAIFLPLALPDAPLQKWYRWVGTQRVVARHKATSPFGPESIKGNFDRNFQHYAWREVQANAALRQFKDTYIMPIHTGVAAKIGASFYPYRDGTLVEVYIEGSADAVDGVMSHDWHAVMTTVKAKIEQVVKE